MLPRFFDASSGNIRAGGQDTWSVSSLDDAFVAAGGGGDVVDLAADDDDAAFVDTGAPDTVTMLELCT